MQDEDELAGVQEAGEEGGTSAPATHPSAGAHDEEGETGDDDLKKRQKRSGQPQPPAPTPQRWVAALPLWHLAFGAIFTPKERTLYGCKCLDCRPVGICPSPSSTHVSKATCSACRG